MNNALKKVVRWNANGCRYVVGRDETGTAGLFIDNGQRFVPFDELDLEDCRSTLGAATGEVLYVSIYRLTDEPEA